MRVLLTLLLLLSYSCVSFLIIPYKSCLSDKFNTLVKRTLIGNGAESDPKLLVDDLPRVKIGVKSIDEIKEERDKELRIKGAIGVKEALPESPPRKSRTPTNTFGTFKMEELYRKSNIAIREMGTAGRRRKEDFGSVNPLQSFTSSVIALAMCLVGWYFSAYLAQHFAVDYLNSEFYPVQRLAIVSRNFVVGIFSLASGFTGVVSLGLLLLTIRVIYGQFRKEFDSASKPP